MEQTQIQQQVGLDGGAAISIFFALVTLAQQEENDANYQHLILSLAMECCNQNWVLLHMAAQNHSTALHVLTIIDAELQYYKELDEEWQARDAQWELRDASWAERDQVWTKRETRWYARDNHWNRLLDASQRREAQLKAEIMRQQAHMERMTIRMRRLQMLHQLHLQQQMMQQGGPDGAFTGPSEDESYTILDRAPAEGTGHRLRAWNSRFNSHKVGHFHATHVPGLMVNARPPSAMLTARFF